MNDNRLRRSDDVFGSGMSLDMIAFVLTEDAVVVMVLSSLERETTDSS